RCIFYSDVCLAGFVGSSLSKFLAAGVIVSFGCLPWRLLCVLGLVCWPHRARQFPGFVAEFAVSVLSCVRVDRARMGPRVVVRRFWLERAWRFVAQHMAAYSNRRIHQCNRLILCGCVCKRHRRHDAGPFVFGSENGPGAAAL